MFDLSIIISILIYVCTYFEQFVFCCCCLHKENFLIRIKSVDFAGDKLNESNNT